MIHPLILQAPSSPQKHRAQPNPLQYANLAHRRGDNPFGTGRTDRGLPVHASSEQSHRDRIQVSPPHTPAMGDGAVRERNFALREFGFEVVRVPKDLAAVSTYAVSSKD